MAVTLESNAFFMGIEYLAIFCCGLMGGLCAIRKQYDLFAILITSLPQPSLRDSSSPWCIPRLTGSDG